jgi:hypothetical protein
MKYNSEAKELHRPAQQLYLQNSRTILPNYPLIPPLLKIYTSDIQENDPIPQFPGGNGFPEGKSSPGGNACPGRMLFPGGECFPGGVLPGRKGFPGGMLSRVGNAFPGGMLARGECFSGG